MGRDPLLLATDIAAAVRAAGGRALIVGGWVRDRLRGHPSKDIDLEIFGLPQDRLVALVAAFGRVEAVGLSFPVYKVIDPHGGDPIDVALPRKESKKGRGHKGFEVQGDPFLSIEEAARRRDFTINAIAWDPLTGAYEDPFDGRGDLARRVLRAVDPARFGDDSLRVLRAVQFAARFEFTLDDGTAALCRRIPLDDLPAERIWFVTAGNGSIALDLAMLPGLAGLSRDAFVFVDYPGYGACEGKPHPKAIRESLKALEPVVCARLQVTPERPYADEMDARDETPPDPRESHVKHMRNFLESLRANVPPICNEELGIRVQAIVSMADPVPIAAASFRMLAGAATAVSAIFASSASNSISRASV